MSSILKALRKVEDEKATLGEGHVDLAHDILRRNYDEPNRFPLSLIGLVSLLLLVAGAGWWLWSAVQPKANVSTGGAGTVKQIQLETVAVPPQQILAPFEKDVVKPLEPLAQMNVTQTQKKDLTSSQLTADFSEQGKTNLVKIPNLQIDEILYHQDSASRLAIINDLPVMVGTDINGARVEEILPDRVRFSYQGILFNKIAD